MSEFLQVVLRRNRFRPMEMWSCDGNAAATAGSLCRQRLGSSVGCLGEARWKLLVCQWASLTGHALYEDIGFIINVDEETRKCELASCGVSQECTAGASSSMSADG
jgi:hypothetical protein